MVSERAPAASSVVPAPMSLFCADPAVGADDQEVLVAELCAGVDDVARVGVERRHLVEAVVLRRLPLPRRAGHRQREHGDQRGRDPAHHHRGVAAAVRRRSRRGSRRGADVRSGVAGSLASPVRIGQFGGVRRNDGDDLGVGVAGDRRRARPISAAASRLVGRGSVGSGWVPCPAIFAIRSATVTPSVWLPCRCSWTRADELVVRSHGAAPGAGRGDRVSQSLTGLSDCSAPDVGVVGCAPVPTTGSGVVAVTHVLSASDCRGVGALVAHRSCSSASSLLAARQGLARPVGTRRSGSSSY